MKERDNFYLKLSLPALIITFLIFLLPLFSVLGRAFKDGPGAVINTFCDAYTWRLLAFTVWESLLSAVISVSLAIPFSVFFSKYSFFGRKAILTASDVAFALPAILCVLGFVIFYGNNGILNNILISLGLIEDKIKFLYSFPSVIMAHVYLNFPVAFSLITSALSGMDEKEEMASKLLGKSNFYTFIRITIPKVKGTIISAFILIFLFCFPSFLIVMSLGGSPKYYTIEAEIYRRTYTDVNTVSSSSLALFSFIIMSFLLLVSGYGREEKKASRSKRIIKKAKGWKRLEAFVLSCLIFLFLAPPLLSIVYRAFFTKDGSFTLKAWIDIASSSPTGAGTGMEAILNSLLIAFLSSSLAVSLSTAISISAVRRKSRIIPLLTSLPMAAGSVSLGLGFAFLSTRLPYKSIYISYILVILAHLVVVMPFTVRTIMPGAKRIPNTLPLASMCLGKGCYSSYRKVEKPMLKSYRRRAFAFAFALSLGEVNATMALAEGKVTTLPILIYKMINQYNYQGASALAIILLTTAIIVFAIGEKEDKTNVISGN
ncbi:MAG: ABC transporter permease [Candidatus Ornithospirochaeta sp.]